MLEAAVIESNNFNNEESVVINESNLQQSKVEDSSKIEKSSSEKQSKSSQIVILQNDSKSFIQIEENIDE